MGIVAWFFHFLVMVARCCSSSDVMDQTVSHRVLAEKMATSFLSSEHYQKRLLFLSKHSNPMQEDLHLHQQKKRNRKPKNQEKFAQRLQKLSNANSQAQLKLQRIYPNFEVINSSFSYVQSTELPVAVSENEFKEETKCSFMGASCKTEVIEHELVRNYIRSSDTVLEFGGRFGTTSCEIAKALKNSGKLVTVEPDSNVWYLLAYNRYLHHCNFWIYRGMVSSKPGSMAISPGSYDTRTLPSSHVSVENNPLSTKSMTINEIQNQLKMTFNVLLIDCEGCIQFLFHENEPEVLKKELQAVETIILEADMSTKSLSCTSNCVDYGKWISLLHENGFQLIYQKLDPDFSDITHYIFKRKNKIT
jgi:FkbM family methyltransferase